MAFFIKRKTKRFDYLVLLKRSGSLGIIKKKQIKVIKIRQSIAAPQFAVQCSSCENGTLLIITFNKPPSNFTLLDLAEHRGHVHILGTVLHTCTCNCCVHTYRLFSKSEQKGQTQMISISVNQSNTHTHTHIDAPLSLRSAHQIKWIL